MSSSAKQLIANGLSVGFDGKVILQNASIQLNAGQIIAIGGSNGVGKSTLIKTLARQLKPLAGNIQLNGTEIWQYSSQEFAKHLAYVPQIYSGNLELTIEEMVMLGRNPHQQWWQWQPSKSDAEAVGKALDAAELTALKSKLLSQISGGERQRVAIATALAQNSSFLLLDEPTSNLDFKHQRELVALLKDLSTKQLGIMLVLHDLNMIAKIADDVVLLEKADGAPSRIAVHGPCHDSLTSENLRRVFEVDIHPTTDPSTGSIYFNPFAS